MRKCLAMLLVLALFCGLIPSAAAAQQDFTERTYPLYLFSAEDTLDSPFPLYFLEGVNDLPYLKINDAAWLLWLLNVEGDGDEGYDLDIEYQNTEVTLTRENGYTATLDFLNDRVVFDDYDAFLHNSSDTTLIDLLSESGFDEDGQAQLFLRDREKSFDRYGDVKTFDLAAYGIDLVLRGGDYYIPMQTFNDIFLYPSLYYGLLFNGKALFLAGDEDLFDYWEGDYSELGYLYYGARKARRSDALAEFGYNELCMALDNLYGLRETHDIERFSDIFWQIGFDEALRGSDPVDADNALKQFIDFYLDDLHSVFNEYSWMSGMRDISSSTGIANRKIEEHMNDYYEARAAVYGDDCPAYEEVGNTAYVTLDSFDSFYYGEAFYGGLEDDELPDDTIGLIIYAHRQITRPGSPIENVVLDLSNNTGGAVDAAVFVLGWLLGDAPFSVKNMATGAMSTSVYRADVSLDRKFDERDTVADKKLYCLISPVSFSCGNLVPAALKASQKATLLGRTSGGGSCIVQPLSTAWGAVFQISSPLRMSFLKNGSFYDIDQGVDPDYYINDIANFYDREALTKYINSLF